MVRFILKKKTKESLSGAEFEEFFTLDCNVPELEKALRSAGYDQYGYEFNDLIGVELLDSTTPSE